LWPSVLTVSGRPETDGRGHPSAITVINGVTLRKNFQAAQLGAQPTKVIHWVSDRMDRGNGPSEESREKTCHTSELGHTRETEGKPKTPVKKRGVSF